MKKTLLQINVEANYGSTGRIASEIGDLAMAKGWDSHIAFGRLMKDTNSTTYRIGTPLGIYHHVAYSRLLGKHGLASTNDTQKLISYIEEIQPTIIHLHNLHGYYLNYEILFGYLNSLHIPVVWTLHDCWSFTGHCTHYEDVGCYKWEKECSSCPQKREYPTSWLIDSSKNSYQRKKKWFGNHPNLHVVTVSNWLNQEVSRSFLANHNRTTIHNGIDTSVFKCSKSQALRTQFNLENKYIILGVASVWSEKKGLGDFITLSKTLEEDETLVLIGLKEEQIKNLPKNIIGIQRTANLEELVAWYSTANLYLNLSVEESFGMTTAEALACGTPVVVYNSTACPEMVTPKTGRVVPKKDIEAVRSAIHEIKIDFNESHYAQCREYVVKRFDKNERYEEYLSLYEQLTQIVPHKVLQTHES
ncbi:MAG: glycosyltransferase [Bacteroidota bacterium]